MALVVDQSFRNFNCRRLEAAIDNPAACNTASAGSV
jgi:hypothetical protein